MTSLFDNVPTDSVAVSQTIINDPQNRHLKIISLGAGVMGMIIAYNFQKHCENVDLTIYEKNADIGGTWYENRYPGCACDVPSHSYTFHFAPNPDWPRYLSKREDIWNYLDRVCNVFNLRKAMKFNTAIIAARWDEDSSQWHITAVRTAPDGTEEEIHDTCDVFVCASGVLNNWKWPEIEGLDTFKGKVIHTADWDQEYTAEKWKGRNVLVVGSGASSLQVVPNMQPHVNHMDIFVRTGVWFAPLSEGFDESQSYTEEEKAQFREEPQKMIDYIKLIDSQLNRMWPVLFKDTEAQKMAQAEIRARMAELIKDPYLLQGKQHLLFPRANHRFTPKFSVGCRRVTPGENYLKSIQQPNVNVHFTGVDRVTPTGVVGADGVHREGDMLICATGFDVSFRPRFPIIGRNGIDLRAAWADGDCTTYLGLTVPDMPNLVMLPGPPVPVQNGSTFAGFHAMGAFVLRVIEKLQADNIRSFAPKREVAQAFMRHCEKFHEASVFSDECRSWYKNNETGKVTAVWPGSAVHYAEALRTPRWEHYDLDYRNPTNMFAWLGNGFVKELTDPALDAAYYVKVENIDPLWTKEIQKTRRNGEQNGGNLAEPHFENANGSIQV